MLILSKYLRLLRTSAQVSRPLNGQALQGRTSDMLLSAKRPAEIPVRRSKRTCVTAVEQAPVATEETAAAAIFTRSGRPAASDLVRTCKGNAHGIATSATLQKAPAAAGKRPRKAPAAQAADAAIPDGQTTGALPSTPGQTADLTPAKPVKSRKRSKATTAVREQATSAAAADGMAAPEPAPIRRKKAPKKGEKAPAPAAAAEALGCEAVSPDKAATVAAVDVASKDAVPKKASRAKSARQIKAEEARVAALERMHQLVAHPEQRIAEIMASRPKKWIGAHVSASGGVERAPVNAAAVGEVLVRCAHRGL